MKRIPQDQRTKLFLDGVYDGHKGMMLWAVRKYVKDSDICEDVFQEAFAKVVRKAETLQGMPPYKMRAYILMIVHGTSIDYLRKEHKHLRVDMEDEVLHSLLVGPKLRPYESMDQYGKVELSLMMKALPVQEQILLAGKYYFGLSVKELAEIVGGTDTGIRTRIYRARKKLLQEWSRSGLNMGDFLNE